MQSIKVFQESQNVLVFDGRKSREKRSFKIDDAIGKSSLNGIFEAECHVRSFSNFNSWSHLHTYVEHVEENWTRQYVHIFGAEWSVLFSGKG